MKLEELLKQYRAENKISQRELARRCDLSNSLISLFEMGKNPQTGKQMSHQTRAKTNTVNRISSSSMEEWGLWPGRVEEPKPEKNITGQSGDIFLQKK